MLRNSSLRATSVSLLSNKPLSLPLDDDNFYPDGVARDRFDAYTPWEKLHGLRGLEGQLRRYCTQVWVTHPRAHRPSIDPSAPREPKYAQEAVRGSAVLDNHDRRLSTELDLAIRISARMIDVCLGANVGVLEKAVGDGLTPQYDPLERLTQYFPVQQWEHDLGRDQVRESVFLRVIAAADLTKIEARVFRHRMDGVTEAMVAKLVSRSERHVERIVKSIREKLTGLGTSLTAEAEAA